MKKNIITVVILSALVFVLIGCASVPVTTFDGNPRESKAIATLEYHVGMLVRLGLYKIDGKLSSSPDTFVNSYHFNKGTDSNGLNLQLLPGKHDLEIVLGRAKEVKILTCDFKAGSRYELLYEDNKLSIVEYINGNPVPVDIKLRDLPEYKEPGEKEPHAVLLEEGVTSIWSLGSGFGAGADGAIIKLYRIDGQRGDDWWYDSVKFKQESVTEKFNIRLKPGMHTLDFYFINGKKYTRMTSLSFNFEAGKKYTLYYDGKINIKDMGLVRLVEVK